MSLQVGIVIHCPGGLDDLLAKIVTATPILRSTISKEIGMLSDLSHLLFEIDCHSIETRNCMFAQRFGDRPGDFPLLNE